MARRISESTSIKIARLYVETNQMVFITAFRASFGDHSRAEDVVQEVFREVAEKYSKFEKLKPEMRVPTLLRLAQWRAIDRWKIDNPRSESVSIMFTDELPECQSPEWLDVEQIVLSRGALDRCAEVMAKMPEQQARVAYMRFAMDMKPAEIADHLAITSSTVRVHVMNARVSLRAEVGDEIPFELDDNDPGKGA